ADRHAARGELRRGRARDARGRRPDDAARGRRGVRRIGDLQVRGPGAARASDRRGDDALPGPRCAREGLARPRRADARARHQGARRGGSAPDPRVVNGADSQLPGPPPTSQFTGRAAYALSQLYYYLVAIVAIGFVIGGTIAAL